MGFYIKGQNVAISVRVSTLAMPFLLGYLAFIPTGPFPIFVAGGLKLDILFSVILLAFMMPYITRLNAIPKSLLIVFGLYLLSGFISVMGSEDLERSLTSWFIVGGYSLLTFLVPLVMFDRIDFIRKSLFLFAVIASILILFVYFYFGFEGQGRFALGASGLSKTEAVAAGEATVDPNMTAAGLYLSLLVYLPALLKKHQNLLPLVMKLGGVFLIVAAATITISRSAFVGFALAMLIPAFLFFMAELYNHPIKWRRKTFNIILASIVGSIVLVLLVYTFFPYVAEGMINKLLRSSSDVGRLHLFAEALDVFAQDFKTILIGNGFMLYNPHNEILRALVNMGLLGFVASTAFLASLFYNVLHTVKGTTVLHFTSMSIIIFILIITLFYGYSKLLWVAFMFLLFMSFEAKYKVKDA